MLRTPRKIFAGRRHRNVEIAGEEPSSGVCTGRVTNEIALSKAAGGRLCRSPFCRAQAPLFLRNFTKVFKMPVSCSWRSLRLPVTVCRRKAFRPLWVIAADAESVARRRFTRHFQPGGAGSRMCRTNTQLGVIILVSPAVFGRNVVSCSSLLVLVVVACFMPPDTAAFPACRSPKMSVRAVPARLPPPQGAAYGALRMALRGTKPTGIA